MHKSADGRIRHLIEYCIEERFRAFFCIVGDDANQQVFLFYQILQRLKHIHPKVLWTFKKDPGFSAGKKKRQKWVEKRKAQGTWDPNIDDPFESFLQSSTVRYCHYSESYKVLGQTFDMCVLSDFEHLTPNYLCRIIETVAGGGLVLMLMKSIENLKELYKVSMDVHSRYKSTGYNLTAEHRFVERMILSFVDCQTMLLLDDEMNVLPINDNMDRITALLENSQLKKKDFGYTETQTKELQVYQEQFAGTALQKLFEICATLDQGKTVERLDTILGAKRPNATAVVTAARGRGKSASLGLSLGAAIYHGYSNIFVSSPAPENVKVLFEFAVKALKALNYNQSKDFMIEEDKEGNVVRLVINRSTRQVISYVNPSDFKTINVQAELLLIDEAAAIPLHIVRQLFGPYLIFLSSTTHGYEGTGRALSLKLVDELRNLVPSKQQKKSKVDVNESTASRMAMMIRDLHEIKLNTPIRYKENDPVEFWLEKLLCLGATDPPSISKNRPLCPPKKCKLCLINRDTLFSYHEGAERFLNKLMGLFVSSHYKNSPNDLLLLCDSPCHFVFALLPQDEEGDQENKKKSNGLPDVYVAIHVALEGRLPKQVIRESQNKGLKPAAFPR
eukprot:GHVP01053487.1.p1 GENE.GHVP01053487.1~~GHVP01053487.1.p1  ORF type:complete len:626 (-),score=104.85 GHVP01053487.1:1198-3048(-)